MKILASHNLTRGLYKEHVKKQCHPTKDNAIKNGQNAGIDARPQERQGQLRAQQETVSSALRDTRAACWTEGHTSRLQDRGTHKLPSTAHPETLASINSGGEEVGNEPHLGCRTGTQANQLLLKI